MLQGSNLQDFLENSPSGSTTRRARASNCMAERVPLRLAAFVWCLLVGLQAAPLPSEAGMTDLAADGYLELRRRFQAAGSVGVVGSSGNLLYHGHGSAIDLHGAVMRFNGAVTQGYTCLLYTSPSPRD